MGLRISWICFDADKKTDVLNALNVGESAEIVLPLSTEICGALTPHGKYVVVISDFYHELVQADALEAASDSTDLVAYSGCENTSTSMAMRYEAGMRHWYLWHSSEMGHDHLEVEGDPENLDSILDDAVEEASKEGYDAVYSVPAKIAENACDFNCARMEGLGFVRLDSRKNALPGSKREVNVLWCAALARLLAPLGFEQASDDEGEPIFQQHNEKESFKVIPYTWKDKYDEEDDKKYVCNAWLELRNHQVQRYITEFSPDYLKYPTASFTGLTGKKLPDLHTEHDLLLYAEVVCGKIQEMIPKCKTMESLDRIINGDRTEIDFMEQLQGISPLVIAILARNPNAHSMTMEANSRLEKTAEDPTGFILRIASQAMLDREKSPSP